MFSYADLMWITAKIFKTALITHTFAAENPCILFLEIIQNIQILWAEFPYGNQNKLKPMIDHISHVNTI